MNLLSDRAKRRAELVKLARDSNVSKLAELFLAQYRTDLEHLKDGDHVEDHVPVGKEKFTHWLKETIVQYFPNLSGLVENERSLKDYAGQVGDAVAKSDTGVQNPIKDYKVSQDPVFIKAQYSPAKPSAKAPYEAPVERFYHDKDHSSSTIEKDYDTGVQNQNLMNKMHPIKPFLSKDKQQDLYVDKQKALYNVFKDNEALISPSAPNESKKEASLEAFKLTRKAMQLFGPTTMVARQCPDHPGQQLSRVADNVRQCPLDGKVYDYTRGFTTEDGKQFNGGSVQAQNSIPPGSVVIRQAATNIANLTKTIKTAADTPKTHAFLYQVLQYIPAESRERQILNYKFQHNLSLEKAIIKFEEAETLAAQQKAQPAASKTAAVALNIKDLPSVKQKIEADQYSPQELQSLYDQVDARLDRGPYNPELQDIFELLGDKLQSTWSEEAKRARAREEELENQQRAEALATQERLVDVRWREMELTRGEFFNAVKTNYPISQQDTGEWLVKSRVSDKFWIFPTEVDAKEKVLELADWREYDKYDRQGDRGTVKRNPPVFEQAEEEDEEE